MSSYLCAEYTKIVKQAEEELADRKSNRMSIKLYRIKANVLRSYGKLAPVIIYAAHKGILER